MDISNTWAIFFFILTQEILEMASTADFHIDCHGGGYFSSGLGPSMVMFSFSQGVGTEGSWGRGLKSFTKRSRWPPCREILCSKRKAVERILELEENSERWLSVQGARWISPGRGECCDKPSVPESIFRGSDLIGFNVTQVLAFVKAPWEVILSNGEPPLWKPWGRGSDRVGFKIQFLSPPGCMTETMPVWLFSKQG